MRALAFLVIWLAGCATTNGDLQGIKDPWYGVGYDEVVVRWGQPTRYTTLADGGYVYTWLSESTAPRGRVYPTLGFLGGSGGVAIDTGVTVAPGGAELVRCDRTLVFRNARVSQQTWQGDPGYCAGFKR